ncbi:MAG: PP2C family protein-serine/threonine phosphatase, partial [Niallia sp.]
QQFAKQIYPGDMIVLMSDGVTESRTKEGFIDKEILLGYIRKHMHLDAQDIVKNVYKELEKIQDFQLRDDFTLIIFKREV